MTTQSYELRMSSSGFEIRGKVLCLLSSPQERIREYAPVGPPASSWWTPKDLIRCELLGIGFIGSGSDSSSTVTPFVVSLVWPLVWPFTESSPREIPFVFRCLMPSASAKAWPLVLPAALDCVDARATGSAMLGAMISDSVENSRKMFGSTGYSRFGEGKGCVTRRVD